tara:strand:+ start:15298 stop:15444 length:147 start_codon:yes stop_codon:yes gene_type:complete
MDPDRNDNPYEFLSEDRDLKNKTLPPSDPKMYVLIVLILVYFLSKLVV